MFRKLKRSKPDSTSSSDLVLLSKKAREIVHEISNESEDDKNAEIPLHSSKIMRPARVLEQKTFDSFGWKSLSEDQKCDQLKRDLAQDREARALAKKHE